MMASTSTAAPPGRGEADGATAVLAGVSPELDEESEQPLATRGWLVKSSVGV